MAGFRGHFGPGARQGALQFLAGNEVWYFGDQFVASQGTEIQRKKGKQTNQQPEASDSLLSQGPGWGHAISIQITKLHFCRGQPSSSAYSQLLEGFTLHMHNTDNYLLYRGQPSSSEYSQLWKTSLFTCTMKIIICCTGASLLHQSTHSFGRLHSSHAQQR